MARATTLLAPSAPPGSDRVVIRARHHLRDGRGQFYRGRATITRITGEGHYGAAWFHGYEGRWEVVVIGLKGSRPYGGIPKPTFHGSYTEAEEYARAALYGQGANYRRKLLPKPGRG